MSCRILLRSLTRRATLLATVGAWALFSGQLLAQAPRPHDVSELLGTWKGTSTCTNRTAAPACHDEVVVYDVSKGGRPGTVALRADKIVNGERVSMGDLTFAYDVSDGCWRADFESPRMTSRWCMTVDGDKLQGTARLLPGNDIVRRVQATRERGEDKN